MIFATAIAFTLLSFANPVKAGTFTDDLGREFTFTGNEKFATRAATGALSLYRMGIQDQITAIWGLWSIRGSDLDVDDPEAGSRYPESDPDVEEVNWLHTKINMSPGCYTNPRGCFRWDSIAHVKNNSESIDYILFIDNGGDDNMKTVTEETGIPVIFIDTFYDYNSDCRYVNNATEEDYELKDKTRCFGRSMIDVAERIEELAIAIGGANTAQIESDKELACQAAHEFTDLMKQKQEDGVRVMTTIIAVKKDDDTGEDYFEFRTLDPIDLWIPRTLEELGMPILHHDDGSLTLDDYSTRVTGDEFFIDCDGTLSVDCNSNTMYPVDFWLIDSRSYLLILNEDNEVNEDVIEAIFPDKAMLAGQHWHYARNDGPLSYYAIYRMLDEMVSRVSPAVRMHDPTECTAVDPKTDVTAQSGGGLDRGEYICYDKDLIQTKYLSGCTVGDDDDDDDEDPCFSGDDVVTLESGQSMRFAEISVGDRILSADKAGNIHYSDVVFLPHEQNNKQATFVELNTSTGNKLRATKNHLIVTCSGATASAGSLTAGQCVRTVTGDDTIETLATVRSTGVYTAVTKSDYIVVGGIVASPFAYNHNLVSAYYNLHRVAYDFIPNLLQSSVLRKANELFGSFAAHAFVAIAGK